MRSLLLVLALAGLAAQEHPELPKDWFCGNLAKTPEDHKCACHRTCELNIWTGEVEEKEDPQCRVYCRRSQCTCLNECDTHHG